MIRLGALLSLLLVSSADAQYRVIIDSASPITVTTPGGPVVVPPPAVPPPVVVPPPTPPARDATPFVYSGACTNLPINADERTMWSWSYPGDFQDFYAYVDGTGNPLPGSHTCYGIFGPGVTTSSGKSLSNGYLWGPRSAMTERPWDIRCVLFTGRFCP